MFIVFKEYNTLIVVGSTVFVEFILKLLQTDNCNFMHEVNTAAAFSIQEETYSCV